MSEVELWNSSSNVGDPTILNTKKYLALMESIRKAEDKELEKVAKVEFVENIEFDKTAENIIKIMMEKIGEKLR